jgi:hypothetical protein
VKFLVTLRHSIRFVMRLANFMDFFPERFKRLFEGSGAPVPASTRSVRTGIEGVEGYLSNPFALSLSKGKDWKGQECLYLE